MNYILQLSCMECLAASGILASICHSGFFFFFSRTYMWNVSKTPIPKNSLVVGGFLHMFIPGLTGSSSKQGFIFPLDSVRLGKLKCPQVQNDAMYVSIRRLRDSNLPGTIFILISHHWLFPRKLLIELGF